MRSKTGHPKETQDSRRGLTSVSTLLAEPRIQALIDSFSRPLVLDAIHEALSALRAALKTQPETASDLNAVVAKVESLLLQQQSARLRPVVNATGILLHTGLGRAVLPQAAVNALAGLNRCCNLQIDLETGLRGSRSQMCVRVLCRLTGAESGLIVNNNAAATFLILSALCRGKEVILSRGQLIEIGGSFRLPDCIHQSGAKMVEVGTTNKTHLRDYEQALTAETALLLRVNPSNYRVVGFTQDVPIAELVQLKQKYPSSPLVVDDLGCGALINLESYGLPKEPTVQESIAAGADLVCFSGDKLIGGPQAGIILGRKEPIDRIKKHPLTRMLRVGKLTEVALEQTLRLFLTPETLTDTNPTLHMLAVSGPELGRRAEELERALAQSAPDLKVRVTPSDSATGGGSLPAVAIPSFALAIALAGATADELCRRLRQNEPPIIARIVRDEVQLDMRTLMDGDDEAIQKALAKIAAGVGSAVSRAERVPTGR